MMNLRIASTVGMVLFFLVILSAQAIDGPVAEPIHRCNQECISVQRAGDMLLFNAMDRSGKSIRSVAHNLALGAANIVMFKADGDSIEAPVFSNVPRRAQAADSGIYTRTITAKYETPTETIFATVIYYHSSSGEPLDVSITEKRFPRATNKQP